MGKTHHAAEKAASKAADAAVSAVGSAAGAVVAPKTALEMVRAKLTSPRTLTLVGVALIAYLIGRRRRSHR